MRRWLGRGVWVKVGIAMALAVSAAGLAFGLVPARPPAPLAKASTSPLPVTVVGGTSGSARRAFQARVFVNPSGVGVASATLAIPAGKRLIIENVSAIARNEPGLRMTIDFFSYIDNNGDGVGDVQDITFHRLALTEQGTYLGTAIATANHKTLVFADEQIGSGHFGVGVQARLTGAATVPAQAQVTFSGYLENIPTP